MAKKIETKFVPIGKVKPNPKNPRVIKDDQFQKLVKSIKEFPKMLEIRPIVLDSKGMVLGGNQRLKACQEAGLKEIPVIYAETLTAKEKERFIIADNVSMGEWDAEILESEWEKAQLAEWGLDIIEFEQTADYSILDDSDPELNEQISQMSADVKKAIQIEFDVKHYDEAYQIVKFWRERNAYVGKMILDFLKKEKKNYETKKK